MLEESKLKKAVEEFVCHLNQPFHLKGIFFDMDGVLYNSMPLHAQSWTQTFEEFGLDLPEHEPYMNEGSTAFFTVRRMFKKYLKQDASDETCERIKNRKHEIMGNMPPPELLTQMPELLNEIKEAGIDSWVVTGSAQGKLINRLMEEFNGAFQREKMVTGLDVKKGKPNPEPYLMAMQKSGYGIHNSIVVENAPLGVESAKAAGLFTVAVNTGPLNPKVLKDAGADLVLPGTEALKKVWKTLNKQLNTLN